MNNLEEKQKWIFYYVSHDLTAKIFFVITFFSNYLRYVINVLWVGNLYLNGDFFKTRLAFVPIIDESNKCDEIWENL